MPAGPYHSPFELLQTHEHQRRQNRHDLGHVQRRLEKEQSSSMSLTVGRATGTGIDDAINSSTPISLSDEFQRLNHKYPDISHRPNRRFHQCAVHRMENRRQEWKLVQLRQRLPRQYQGIHRQRITAMKRHLISILASAAVAVAGCNETNETNAGGLRHDPHRLPNRSRSTPRAKASPKATRTEITAPDGSEFALRITGADFDRSWGERRGFRGRRKRLRRRHLTKIAVEHGDPETERTRQALFLRFDRHRRSGPPRQHRQVTAHVAKSQTFVRITEAFAKFYHDAEFTVTTGSGNEFTFRPDGTGDPGASG